MFELRACMKYEILSVRLIYFSCIGNFAHIVPYPFRDPAPFLLGPQARFFFGGGDPHS
jgi:hypothetical protein